MNQQTDERTVVTAWEYHPIYGCYSRLVFRRTGKDSMILLGREYKDL